MNHLRQTLKQTVAVAPKPSLLVKRNGLWLPKIEALLEGKHQVFATVGAAHLVGPDGLVSQLRARGYEVTRVD